MRAVFRRMTAVEQQELVAASDSAATVPRLTQTRMRTFVRNAAERANELNLDVAKAQYDELAAMHPQAMLNKLREAALIKALGEDISFDHLAEVADGPISDDGLQVRNDATKRHDCHNALTAVVRCADESAAQLTRGREHGKTPPQLRGGIRGAYRRQGVHDGGACPNLDWQAASTWRHLQRRKMWGSMGPNC